jgi:hypothetical protein
MIEELAALSKPEASVQFNKKEGAIWFNPIFCEILEENPGLREKYSNDKLIKEWIEKAYYNAHLAFQREIKARDGALLPYALTADAHIQRMKPSTGGSAVVILGGTPYLREAGNPTITIRKNPLTTGLNSIEVSERKADWEAVDIERNALHWNLENSYTISVSGTTSPGATAVICGRNHPQSRLAITSADKSGNFSMEAVVSNKILNVCDGGSEQFNLGFRIKTTDTSDFTLHEIKISIN